jgi:hypothetical protein
MFVWELYHTQEYFRTPLTHRLRGDFPPFPRHPLLMLLLLVTLTVNEAALHYSEQHSEPRGIDLVIYPELLLVVKWVEILRAKTTGDPSFKGNITGTECRYFQCPKNKEA